MYKTIKSMLPPYQLYAKKLVEEGILEDQAEKKLVDDYRTALDNGEYVVDVDKDKSAELKVHWEPFIGISWRDATATNISANRLKAIAKELENCLTVLLYNLKLRKHLKRKRK